MKKRKDARQAYRDNKKFNEDPVKRYWAKKHLEVILDTDGPCGGATDSPETWGRL